VTAVTDAPAPPPDPGASPPPPARFRMTPTRWIAAALVVAAVAFLAVLATRQSAEEAAAGSPLLGKPAPEVIGPDLDGETVRLSQLRGRYVLLNFFASWCVPCEREHDDLIRFQEAHAEAGDATVLAVIFDDTVENAREFFEERGGDWPVLADERGKVSLDFGVRGPPESFLISPEGIVLTRIIGEVDSDRLERLLTEAERLRAEARAEAEAES
jgi:cytochrome c biogenesis protein CcmG, thiol:disulfide interchange protein DsbE